MLSTKYRLRLEYICGRISNGIEVKLEDMIWAEKLAKANQSAASMLRKARRKQSNPDMQEGSMDDFLNQMDLGDVNPRDSDNTAEWFHREKPDDWRQRD